MRSRIIIILIFITVCLSCTKNIDLDLPLKNPRLVVKGIITNEFGSCQVVLSKTMKYNFTYEYTGINYERGAFVVISDDSNNSDTLVERLPGKYFSHADKYRGQVGRTYKIDIITKDGTHYQSVPEKMTSVPKIDSIYFTRDTKDRYKENPNSYKYKIYITWQDPKDTVNYYMRGNSYYWNNTWKDSIAWISVFNDYSFNGKYIRSLVESAYGQKYFYIKVNLYSLSKSNYDFWNLLFQQTYSSSDDDANAMVPLAGNIFNVNDPKDYAIGYFQVSATSSKQVYIDH